MKMYSRSSTAILIFFCILCFAVTRINGSDMDDDHKIRKTYIVYMGALPGNTVSLEAVHHKLLSEAIGNEEIARKSKLHSCRRSFNAFVARLLPHEANILSEKEEVVSVFLSQTRKVLTTRSWDFMGMPLNVTRNIYKESDTIIALLDSGIDVESQSFNDSGYRPPPSKWKGKCQDGPNFPGCNNKVIGAQYFDYEEAEADEHTPTDLLGHGTHTSSTAAGIVVPEVSYHGIGEGSGRGGVPSARIASYKVCWGGGFCPDSSILAGFDAAIADGVDIISASLGGIYPEDYFQSVVAIGSFHAAQKGILVVCSAGNSGRPFTVDNVAPWIMTVAASSTDRGFDTKVDLDNGKTFWGSYVVNRFGMEHMYALINQARAQNHTLQPHQNQNISACDVSSLDPSKVKGKILFCRGNDPNLDVKILGLGAAGLIQSTSELMDEDYPAEFPFTIVKDDDGDKIDAYIQSTEHPKVKIHKTIAVHGDKYPPLIGHFSSRGPQIISRNILKPDIAAPGVKILAANSKFAFYGEDKPPPFMFLSGTSMSAPHVSGAAAYVKTFHPDWSPAAIKSAIMTTAKPFKNKIEGAELATGSGLLNPIKALNPGLIYDITDEDDSYIKFLCKEGYDSRKICKVTGKKVNCSSLEKAKGTDGLNYPSMHIQLQNTTDISAVFYRTVTYVGEGESVFKAITSSPEVLSVTVTPNTLSFSERNEQMSFNVTLEGKFMEGEPNYISASLGWTDGKHNVRTPILVYHMDTE